MSELQEAFEEFRKLMPAHKKMEGWQETKVNRYGEIIRMTVNPYWDGNCCGYVHNWKSADDSVCARELAWRRYIEVRDRVH